MDNVILKKLDKKKANSILAQIKQNNSDKKKILYNALNICNYYELNYIYSRIPITYKGLLSLSYLIRKDETALYRTPILPKSSTIDCIGKLVYAIKRHSKDINLYLKYKAQVDSSFITGNYDDARRILNKINKDISYSFWAIAYEIKIDRLQYGVQKAIETHNRFFHRNNSAIFQKFCNAAFHTSSLEYTTDIEKKIFHKGTGDFSCFNNILQAHFFAYKGVSEGIWFCTDMNSSFIDLYNNFIIYLPNLEKDTIQNEEFRFFLEEILSIVEDPYLRKICFLYNISKSKPKEDAYRQIILKNYLSRNFQYVVDNSLDYIEFNPLDIEILCIYIKSCIVLNHNELEVEKDDSIIQQIKYHLYNIYSSDSDVSYHYTKIKGICQSLFHIEEIRYLYSSIVALENNNLWNLCNETWKYSAYLNIGDASFYKDEESKKHYLYSLGLESILSDIFDSINHPLSIDCYELSIGGQNWEYVSQKIISDYKNGEFLQFLSRPVTSYIFDYYVEKYRYEDAIIFYVNHLINCNSTEIQVKKESIDKILKDHERLVLHIPLELAIFYHSMNVEIDTIYLTYKQYLRFCEVKKASELQISGDKRQEYFLSNVVSQRVITLHVLKFKTIEQVMDERSDICTNLYNYFGHRKYLDEISVIMRDKQILALNKQVVDNKIYVDVQSIRDNELDEAKTLFKMYEQSASTELEIIQNSDIKQLVENLKSMGYEISFISEQYEKNQEKIDYQYDILERIFIHVRDQFLYNPKSGLDNYLSTRIRHGTLVNQLRNHFEGENLITNKKGGKYSPNDYWPKMLGIEGNIAVQCVERFLSFSEQIDCIIFKIKDEYVQVYTEENSQNQHASFNYDIVHFREGIKQLQARTELNSYDAIISEMINILWQHTDKCLIHIRNYLTEVQETMIEALHSIEKDITFFITKNNPMWASFHDAVTRCVNNIQEDFQVVSKWFNRSNSIDFDFTIRLVVDTCLSFINRNDRTILKAEVETNSLSEIHGRYFTTLYDMFYDILNNILFYEQHHEVGNTCKIVIDEDEGFLKIRITNPIDTYDMAILQQKVSEINSNLQKMFIGGRSRMEGNSGCIKIFNAVHNHLGSRTNKYINSVENDTFIVDINIELKPIRK